MRAVHQAGQEERQAIIARLGGLLADRPEVRFACVHGSFIEPALGFRDIDVAVWLDGSQFQPDTALDYRMELSGFLERRVAYPIDVQVLNHAALSFKHAATGGVLLTAQDKNEWYEFREHTWTEYLDFAPIERQALLDLLDPSR